MRNFYHTYSSPAIYYIDFGIDKIRSSLGLSAEEYFSSKELHVERMWSLYLDKIRDIAICAFGYDIAYSGELTPSEQLCYDRMCSFITICSKQRPGETVGACTYVNCHTGKGFLLMHVLQYDYEPTIRPGRDLV